MEVGLSPTSKMDGDLIPQQSVQRKSARHRRAMSAIARPSSDAGRPPTAGRQRRPYSAYTKRGSEENSPKYDAPETNREWWRFYMKDTPVPGSYRLKGFLDELQKNPSSYRFRDSARAKSASHQKFERTGQHLLPGAYEHEDFLMQTTRRQMTYGFKDITREDGPKIGHGYGDKDINTSPTWYNVVDYSDGANERDTKTSSYKSTVKRTLSAPQFRIVKGPGPGQYDPAVKRPTEICSSFKSKVPRFNSRPSKVPGPGSYSYSDSVFGQPKPLPAALQHLRKKHGITVT